MSSCEEENTVDTTFSEALERMLARLQRQLFVRTATKGDLTEIGLFLRDGEKAITSIYCAQTDVTGGECWVRYGGDSFSIAREDVRQAASCLMETITKARLSDETIHGVFSPYMRRTYGPLSVITPFVLRKGP